MTEKTHTRLYDKNNSFPFHFVKSPLKATINNLKCFLHFLNNDAPPSYDFFRNSPH